MQILGLVHEVLVFPIRRMCKIEVKCKFFVSFYASNIRDMQIFCYKGFIVSGFEYYNTKFVTGLYFLLKFIKKSDFRSNNKM